MGKAALMVLATVAVGAVRGPNVFYEGFETLRPSWTRGEADASVTIQKHDRTDERARNGLRCERLVLNLGRGQYVFYHLPVPKIAVTPETAVSLAVKGSRSGIQLLVQVVLPHEPAGPPTLSARRVVLPGPTYQTPGLWQELRVTQVAGALERQLRLLRAQLGRDVDVRDAYLDRVSINVYTGPGEVEVFLDDLIISPFLPATALSEERASLAGVQIPSGQRLRLLGEKFLLENKPWFFFGISWARFSGGTVPWWQRFPNAIRLVPLASVEALGTNTPEKDLGVLAVVDLTAASGNGAIDKSQLLRASSAAPLLGWVIGAQGFPRHVPDRPLPLDQLARLAETLRQSDASGRPVLVASNRELQGVSMHADGILVGAPVLGTTWELADYAAWLEAARYTVRPGTPLVAVLPLDAIGPWKASVEPAHVRLVTYACLLAGSRGIAYQIDQPAELEANGVLPALELLSLELQLLEPFLAQAAPVHRLRPESLRAFGAGEESLYERLRKTNASTKSRRGDEKRSAAEPGEPEGTGWRGLSGATFRAGSSVVALLAWLGPQAQLVPGQWSAEELSVVIPGVPETATAWQVTAVGLIPLDCRRVAGGAEVRIREFDLTSAVVLMTDWAQIRALRDRAMERAPRAAQLALEIAEQEWRRSEQVLHQLREAGPPDVPPIQQRAYRFLEEARLAWRQHDYPRCYDAAQRACRALRLARRATWEALQGPGATPASSPFLASWELLPRQRALLEMLATVTSDSATILLEEDFNDAQRLRQQGWTQFTDLPTDWSGRIFLTDGVQGQSLRAARLVLRWDPRDKQEQAVPVLDGRQGLTLISPPFKAPQDGVLVVSFDLKVPMRIEPDIGSVWVFDSEYGPEWSLRVRQSTANHPYTLYRPVRSGRSVQVMIRLQGVGEAYWGRLRIGLIPIQAAELPQEASTPFETRSK
jgi:hypothetical protein